MPTQRRKTRGITLYLDPKYEHKINYLKLLPGGLTGFIEKSLDNVVVDEELVKAIEAKKNGV